jgi:UDP-arabinose 4-epimerase
MTRVLVTGGAGYVGSHTCKLLAANGIKPIAFDSLTNGHREAVRWGPLIVGDIRDRAAVRTTLIEHEITAVFHFAALAYVGESVTQPDSYYDVNVAGSLALLEAMRETGVAQIIFSSSCASYGLPDRVPVDERQPQRPINPYGWTKLIGEQMLRDYSAAYGLRYAILRYFNAAGCDLDGHLVEKHEPEPHLIPRALMAAGGFGPELQILGTDYDTPDGTAVRDYIHVSDLATGHRLAFSKLSQGAGRIAVNLGTGRGYSVREIVETVERVTGLAVPITEGPRRPGDPPVLIASTDLSAKMLGFAPAHSDLDTIIRSAWRGIQSVHGAPARSIQDD